MYRGESEKPVGNELDAGSKSNANSPAPAPTPTPTPPSALNITILFESIFCMAILGITIIVTDLPTFLKKLILYVADRKKIECQREY